MTLTTETINSLIGIKESYQASDALMKILFDREKREEIFKQFLQHDTHLEKDWFHVYFEEEHANKKKYAQDFTPTAISNVASQLVRGLTGQGGTRLDVATGTGSLTICKWYEDCLKYSPFDYLPSMYLYQCEELSDRALPFLLFNLMIRGMNATDNPALAKYFTDREHAMRVCRLIDEALGVRTRLEDRKQVYIITKVKRDCDEYLRAIIPRADMSPVLKWSDDISDAITFTDFNSMGLMCNFIDSLRENDCQAKCGHQMFYK